MPRILFIGLDVDDKSFNCYALFDGDAEGSAFKVKPNLAALLKPLEKFKTPDVTFHFCYESTYSGYHLCRAIREAGHECEIIAAGLIPELASDRVKTDRLDAEKLARLFSKGMLTKIHIPAEEDEYDRTMVRSRGFLKDQHKSLKHHMVSVSKQIGWHFRGEFGEKAQYWTEAHRQWLREKVRNAPESVKLNFKILISQLDSLEEHIEDYAKKIQKISTTKKYKDRVQSLVCYRGISVLSAMVIITELGDIRRFSHPSKVVSYVGMDVAEYSSGGKERRYSMTKMGNKHLRKILIEASQSATRLPALNRELKRRREGASLQQKAIADKCMKRLHTKSLSLLYKSKPMNKIKGACAREMIGFIWESLNLVS